MLTILLYALAAYLLVCYAWGMYMGLLLLILGRKRRRAILAEALGIPDPPALESKQSHSKIAA